MIVPPRILAIAGSDSSGGAGIQADIKTITMLGGYAMTAITAVTAQNTIGVQDIQPLPDRLVAAQFHSCVQDIGLDAIKIGMLGSADIAQVVAGLLTEVETPVVFDPVMVATSGSSLADSSTISAFRRIMDQAYVITPNLPELAVLCDVRELADPDAITRAATGLAAHHDAYVVAKGGHGKGKIITDLLVGPDGAVTPFNHNRIDTHHTHGTGCTLSSAIATLLGQGHPVELAAEQAVAFVQRAIVAAPGFGEGSGPLGHHAVR